MKTIIITFSLAAFLLLASLAWGHPAKGVNIAFDKATKVMTVSVAHDVKDNVKHFIKTIQITVNQKDVLTHNLTLQDNMKGGTYSYKLNDVKPGDKITVTTTCNFVGKKSASLIVK